MGIFTAGRKASFKRFSYEPRFWDPSKEESLKRRMRMKSNVRRGKPARFVYVIMALVLAFWIYLTL
ncbi:MAG: hypothetical protein ACI80V_001774 [Rhodothermales bacterium]|jgi:hypothetical protein